MPEGNQGGTSIGSPNQGGISVSPSGPVTPNIGGASVTEVTAGAFVSSSAGGENITPAANLSGLLEGAGETVEADPRGSGAFDLTARAFREIGKLKGDVNGIKQVI